MEVKTKQRLVGTVVLLVLAVLLLPLLFDGSGYEERRLAVELPAEPTLEKPFLLKPKSQQRPSTANVAPTTAPVERELVADEALALKEKPQLDAEGIPVAWTLQLASFKDEQNASSLRDRLTTDGYKAYIRQKDELNKVFVGPDLQRSSLERLRLAIKRDYRLDGLILRYNGD